MQLYFYLSNGLNPFNHGMLATTFLEQKLQHSTSNVQSQISPEISGQRIWNFHPFLLIYQRIFSCKNKLLVTSLRGHVVKSTEKKIKKIVFFNFQPTKIYVAYIIVQKILWKHKLYLYTIKLAKIQLLSMNFKFKMVVFIKSVISRNFHMAMFIYKYLQK